MNAKKDVIGILFYWKTSSQLLKKMNASATLSASRVIGGTSFTRYVRMIKSVSLPLLMI